MEFGVFFPQLEIGADPVVTRDFVQAVEGLGYSHLMVGDHPLGVDPTSHPGLGQRYSLEDSFPEPLVLLGYIAAVTKQIDLVTSVVILPQRQTALVAKQAAQVDVLSGGRLRLGVGVGWNKVEYEALGQDFHSRGRRQEEQIALLRSLWTQPVVTFQGTWDRVTGVGLNPLPVQRPIPIWLGGEADVVLRRIARLADGWIRNSLPDEATGLLIPNPPMRSGLGVGTRGEGRGTRRSALDSDKWGRWRPLVGVGGADGGPGQRRWGGVGGTACKGRQSRTGPVRLCGVVE